MAATLANAGRCPTTGCRVRDAGRVTVSSHTRVKLHSDIFIPLLKC